MKLLHTILFSLFIYTFSFAQVSILPKPAKVKHAEPLYLDLMRDLGARKGEAEFNVGYGTGRFKNRVEHHTFIEYEWAVANRLGLEIEIPVLFKKDDLGHSTNRVEGLKLGTQYTFLVDEKRQTSLAIGYVHEMEFGKFNPNVRNTPLFEGLISSPFFIAAKNFNQISTLIYTGPEFEYGFKSREMQTNFVLNANIHYMVPNSSHYIGIENDMRMEHGHLEYIMRPQAKLALSPQIAVGLVCGVPIKSDEFQMDFMTRLIWEPKF
ncbi:hypothetical protein OKW96_11375 [Sphingobacterium sp. KU25419]|nr:hypothetical protein OKW96_11375 [Sphingobacterium sp. KU25419]